MSSTLEIAESGQKSLEAKQPVYGLRFFSLNEIGSGQLTWQYSGSTKTQTDPSASQEPTDAGINNLTCNTDCILFFSQQ